MQNKYHVKKGDKVIVNTGSWKGEKAKVAAILNKKDRVVLELLDASKQEKLGMRTVRKTRQNPNGGLIERSVSVHVSNVTKIDEEKSE